MAPRILVLGASGLLGRTALGVLGPDLEVWGACRHWRNAAEPGIPAARLVEGLEARIPDAAAAIVDRVKPDVALNAVGIVKQRAAAADPIEAIEVNSLWPHRLAAACAAREVRLVHVSTDCVFSGARGHYAEIDTPDEAGLYGRSKLLGEPTGLPRVVTLRTSFVGWQPGDTTGLVEWFAAHRDEPLRGYRRAIFSGLSARTLVETIRDVVLPDEGLAGLWHVAGDPITKLDLLVGLADRLGWQVDLAPVDEPAIDRSLDGSRFRTRTGWRPPSWPAMLDGLAREYAASRGPVPALP